MFKTRWPLGLGLCATLWLGACGESQDQSSRLGRTLGGVKEGAPLAPAISDPGILQDATSYQPSRLAEASDAASEVRPAPGLDRGGGSAGGTEAGVRAAVANLVYAVRDGEVSLALRAFRSEDVRLLSDQSDALFATFGTLDTLGRYLKGQLEPTKVEALLAKPRGLEAAPPRWEMLDPQNASVTPNPASVLFGPAKATPTLRLTMESGQWRFRLEAPLTQADVDGILTYHQQLQEQLGSIIDWVARTPAVDEALLKAALEAAVAGQPVELPAEAPPPETPPEPTEEGPPPEARPPRGVRPPGV